VSSGSMDKLALSCKCGQVQGHASDVTPSSGTRINCYCADCQSFANWLGSDNLILDQGGGTDIYQIPIARLKITKGQENIRCLRLKRKGLYRWYTSCCNTPIGNSGGSSAPFIGLIHSFRDIGPQAQDMTGKVLANIQTKAATGPLAPNVSGNQYLALVRALSKVATWKLRGLNKPSPLFKNDGKAVSKPLIVEDEG
jgi:uncharacterized protein DUF6151